jgi:hypothetical protein
MKNKLFKNRNPQKAAACKQQILEVTNLLLGPYGDNEIIHNANNEATYTTDGSTTNEHPNAIYANGDIEIRHPLEITMGPDNPVVNPKVIVPFCAIYANGDIEITHPLENTMGTDKPKINPKIIVPFGIEITYPLENTMGTDNPEVNPKVIVPFGI